MRCAGTDHALAGPENGSVVALLSEATASSHPTSNVAIGVDWHYGNVPLGAALHAADVFTDREAWRL